MDIAVSHAFDPCDANQNIIDSGSLLGSGQGGPMRSSGLSPESSLNDLKEWVNRILIQFSDGLDFDQVANDIKRAKRQRSNQASLSLSRKFLTGLFLVRTISPGHSPGRTAWPHCLTSWWTALSGFNKEKLDFLPGELGLKRQCCRMVRTWALSTTCLDN